MFREIQVRRRMRVQSALVNWNSFNFLAIFAELKEKASYILLRIERGRLYTFLVKKAEHLNILYIQTVLPIFKILSKSLVSAEHLCDLSVLFLQIQNLVTLFVILCELHNIMIMT